jgi:hypothetical protein
METAAMLLTRCTRLAVTSMRYCSRSTGRHEPRPAPVAIRSLLAAGLTVGDVADLLRAHPRAIKALIG